MNISSISCICEEQAAMTAHAISDVIKGQKIRQSNKEIKHEIHEIKNAMIWIHQQMCSMHEDIKTISMDMEEGLKEVKSLVNQTNMKLSHKLPLTPKASPIIPSETRTLVLC